MTESEMAKAKIEEHRKEIDALDEQIVLLLNKRAGESLAIRKLKPLVGMDLYDPDREKKIFDRLESMNKGPMHPEDIHEIYATLLKVMKAIKE